MSPRFGFNVKEDILMRMVVGSCVSMFLFLILMYYRLLKTQRMLESSPLDPNRDISRLEAYSLFSRSRQIMSLASAQVDRTAATGYIRIILHLCILLGPGLLWINRERPVNYIGISCNALKLRKSLLKLICELIDCWV